MALARISCATYSYSIALRAIRVEISPGSFENLITNLPDHEFDMEDFKEGYDHVIRIGYHGEMFKKDLTEILKEFRKANPKTKVYLSQEPQDELMESFALLRNLSPAGVRERLRWVLSE